MSGLKIYFDLMSQPSRAVLMFLKVNNIPCTEKPVALRKGEHFTEEYAKINPFQTVPAIDDDGFKLVESVAILKYLCSKYHTIPDHWYPREIQKRAKVDEYLAWQHMNTRLYASSVFRIIVLDPQLKNIPVDQEKLRRFRAELDKTLDYLENVFLKDHAYFAGDEISIADILGVCELMQPSICGVDIFPGRPKLRAWMDRTKARLQPYFDETHKVLYKAKENFLQRQLSRQSSKANM